MAADFFERQDAARQNTTRLVVLFILAVLAIVVSVHLLLGFTIGYLSPGSLPGRWSALVDPGLLMASIGGTLLVVGGGSLFKIAQLRGGGRVVAEELGGRLINPDTAVPAEQQLINVVEEMAIASGTPVPPVYLLENETGINAFAAGFTPADAVIGVTRGTMERLTRDELQGVIAHEFSHIVNGDMRLNIRLMGVLHGILIIGMLGYFLLRTALYGGMRSRRGRSRDNNAMPILALGAGLAAIGFFGTLFGNMIKAAVSRQREFLADAAAVQFTRLPQGIANALRKIGGLQEGSSIQNPNAPEASHMFFGRATSGLSGLFSTHPPLEERIRRIDASWDGTLLEPTPLQMPAMAPPAAAAAGRGAAVAHGGLPAAAALGLADAIGKIGRPDPAHLRYAGRLIASLPPELRQAAHEAYGSRAVIYALLLDADATIRKTQLRHLSAAADPHVFEDTLRLVPSVAQLDVRARLPLLELTLPALRELTADQFAAFSRNVRALVEADAAIDLFEWSLQRILLHDLQAHHGRVAVPGVRHRSLAAVQPQIEILLSALAHAGQRDAAGAARAFDAARHSIQAPHARLHDRQACAPDALDRALGVLAEASPAIKRQLLEAAAATIAADRTVTAAEAELLRAFAASLDCPMPPLLGHDG